MSSAVSFKKAKPVTPAAAPATVTPAAAPAPAPAAVVETPAPAMDVKAAQALAAPAPTSTALAQQTNYGGIGGFEGEFTSKDMATPYLSLFGKTSKGFEENPSWLGQWIYDKQIPLGTKIRVIFIRATKWFVEDLPFGDKTIPQRFARMEHARAAGFNESQLAESCDLDLLIEVDANTEGVDELAYIFDGDKAYIPARYGVRSSAYGKTVGILTKDASGFLRSDTPGQPGNLINGAYDMESAQRTSPKGTYYIPQLKTAGRTSASLRQQIIDKLGNTAA